MTIDHVNPEAPWPELERLREATAQPRASSSRRGSPLYPEYVAELERWCDPRGRAGGADGAPTRSGLAREDAWAPGR